MLVQTTWKARPLTPEQSNRMMTTWGKIEAKMAEHPDVERLGFYMNADGSGGSEILKSADTDAAHQLSLEFCLAMGEFLELESKVVLDLDTAMPAIVSAMEYVNG